MKRKMLFTFFKYLFFRSRLPQIQDFKMCKLAIESNDETAQLLVKFERYVSQFVSEMFDSL